MTGSKTLMERVMVKPMRMATLRHLEKQKEIVNSKGKLMESWKVKPSY